MKLALLFAPFALYAAPAFVQVNSATPQGKAATVAVAFTKAQSAGNLNVIAIGWNDSATTVKSVTDTKGNIYAQVAPIAFVTSKLSQTIWYAKNIAVATAGANTVTVTFAASANIPDVRIAEYSGLDTNAPFDGTVPGTGTNASATTSALTVANATDLLVAAETTTTSTASAGSGWTSRIITKPDSDLLEDRQLTAAGSYSATAPLDGSGAWVIQMVAFKAAGVTPPPPPPPPPSTFSITSVVNGLANGTYTVDAPSFPGYTVMPVTQTLTINGANVTATFTATATVANNSVKLAWGAGTMKACAMGTSGCTNASSIVGYNVYRSTTSGGPYTLLTSSPVTQTVYTDANPPAGNDYYVAATVDNLGDVSGFSNEAKAAVP